MSTESYSSGPGRSETESGIDVDTQDYWNSDHGSLPPPHKMSTLFSLSPYHEALSASRPGSSLALHDQFMAAAESSSPRHLSARLPTAASPYTSDNSSPPGSSLAASSSGCDSSSSAAGTPNFRPLPGSGSSAGVLTPAGSHADLRNPLHGRRRSFDAPLESFAARERYIQRKLAQEQARMEELERNTRQNSGKGSRRKKWWKGLLGSR
jgi:hypothetical protein